MEHANATSSTSPQHAQQSPPIPLSKRTSSKNFRSNAPALPSPPTTPPPLPRQPRHFKKVRRPLRAYASEEPISASRHHSHGLSWTSTTRDSVVDNLLFSLDNLSKQNLGESESQAPDSEEKRLYLASLSTSASMNDIGRRARGHTHSSSTSDYDRPGMDSPLHRLSPSNQGRHSANGPAFVPKQSMDGKSLSNGRPDALSKDPPDGLRLGDGNLGHEHTDSEPLENGHSAVLDPSRLAFGGGGRSISMDPIYSDPSADPLSVLDRGRPVPSVHSKYEPPFDADAAPEPIVAAGPRKMQNPTATGPVYVNPAPGKNKQSSLRKITTQTDLRASATHVQSPPIPQDIRNQAMDFVRTSSMRGTPAVPQTSGRDAAVPPSVATTRKKDSSTTQERPGFFKRVFGSSSRSVSNTAERPTSTHQSLDADASMDSSRTRSQVSTSSHPRSEAGQTTSAPTSYPPSSLNKKSSFFRRRKKSVTDTLQAPPLPINVSKTNSLLIQAAEPSPSISSLRKVMDPYLTQEHARPRRLDDEERPATQDTNSDSLDIFHSGYTPPPDASLGARLPGSRERTTLPGMPRAESPIAKMKLQKRKPEPISTRATSNPADGRLLGGSAQAASPSFSDEQAIEPPKVSPLSPMPLVATMDDEPSSRPSTGDGIIASQAASPVNDTLREFSAGNNISLDMNEEGWVIKHHSQLERSPSRISERLILRPTPSEERLNILSRAASISPRESALQSPVESRHLTDLPERKSSRQSETSNVQIQHPTGLTLPTPQDEYGGLSRTSSGPSELPLSSPILDDGAEYRERARKIFEGNQEDVSKADAAAWMGEGNNLSTRTLQAYMQLFDFSGLNILAALRSLCGKLILRGETQQFDRIITALSARWCECNPNHGFKAQDVVHTIIYSLILLNTDLHLADIGEKMSRNQYVKNALPTVKRVVLDAAPHAFDETLKPGSQAQFRPSLPWIDSLPSAPTSPVTTQPISPNERTSFDENRPPPTSTSAKRMSIRQGMFRSDFDGQSDLTSGTINSLVNSPWNGSLRSWETEIENMLKAFWTSIRTDPLPLYGNTMSLMPPADRSLSMMNVSNIKRSGSIISKAPSENMSYRSKQDFRSMAMRWQGRGNRSRPKIYPASTVASSSRTSFEDGNSIWSPAQSSKYSISKTLTSASVGSLGYHFTPPDAFKHSIGFANALSQAIIREETANGDGDSFSMPGGLLEDETLTLAGAPWAKEGLVKHKHHLETPDRKAKERSWSECFAVISKGKLTLFAFNTSTKSQSLGRKAHPFNKSGKAASVTATKVGGGDWMENAETLETFVLRQTIASTLPPPGYSKVRPHVWALSLPSGAVHLFQVGTPEIAEEFMSTANYWSARLSKEPLAGGVSNIEYGWSENVINTALLDRSESWHTPPSSMQTRQMGGFHSMSGDRQQRPSLQSSMRSSFDQGFRNNPARLPGDKATLMDWQPPSQSMMASQLMEVDQLKQLTAYVMNSEQELEKHNELKHAIELAFSPRHPNFNKAMTNWQRKSDYLLREIVKFRTYIDCLSAAGKAKEAFYAKRAEGRLSPVAKDEGDESQTLSGRMMRDITPRGIHTSG